MSDDGDQPTVAHLATLYLGNILYALETTALGLDGEGKQEDAAFYRGIARLLAEAYGREQRQLRGAHAPDADAPSGG
ncbi:MAG TPA: hypothetical protein VFS08_16710 [Gemmatimonadaceae bacterium]|nr:hypothetical protein [Gemmatimonadaceae bacterium]